MPAKSAITDLLLHPVRMRIVQSFLGGLELTTRDLRDRLADVPPATLYRHLNALAKGGVLDVVDVRKVRGAVEKRYALPGGTEVFTETDLAAMSPAEHLRLFTSFLAGLLGTYARYLDRERIDLVRDGVSYRAVTLQLSDAELYRLLADPGYLPQALANESRADRRSRLIARIVMPDDTPPGAAQHQAANDGKEDDDEADHASSIENGDSSTGMGLS